MIRKVRNVSVASTLSFFFLIVLTTSAVSSTHFLILSPPMAIVWDLVWRANPGRRLFGSIFLFIETKRASVSRH